MGLRRMLIRGEQGQALVEFSFICVILLMLAGGVADAVNIMRYNIALRGAATEAVNQISTINLNRPDAEAVCANVIIHNFCNSLGDGNTTYSYTVSSKPETDSRDYKYHDYNDGSHREWITHREYWPVTITMERNQVLLTPFGQLIFGDKGNNRQRNMKVTTEGRV